MTLLFAVSAAPPPELTDPRFSDGGIPLFELDDSQSAPNPQKSELTEE